MSDSLSTKPAELPWYEAYPQPSTKTPAQVSRDEVLAWLKEGQRPGKDFLVVDVRKLDHTGGFLNGSLNLPIESLYPALSTVYQLSKNAGVHHVLWYCVTSRGRGNRAAAWFADYLAQQNEQGVKSAALYEGMLGWALAGEDYTPYIDEFDPTAWQASDATQHQGQLR